VNADSSHQYLGEVVIATRVTTSGPSPRRARNITLLLAVSVWIVATGFGIIMPIFARRLGEFGSGVEALALLTMSFALAAFIAAPLMGSLADRIGRRPLILVALASYIAVNIGFLFARSTEVFIAVRVVEGALTAGFMPAAIGMVADIFPERRRAQWVAILMASMGAGIIFGPVVGGVLYDGWGFKAPFIVSAVMASISLVAATVLVPETRTREVRRRDELLRQRSTAKSPDQQKGSFWVLLWASLPRPLHLFATLLLLDFILIFGFTYIEPQMIFYFYGDLGWTTIQFGGVVAAFGLALVFGQIVLARWSDKFGRKPVIVVGALLFTSLPLALAYVTSFLPMVLFAVSAGLGVALITPALSAFYLDITTEQHRARIIGIKSSAASLGGVAGPLVLVGVSAFATPRGVFLSAAGLLVFSAVLALVGLTGRRGVAAEPSDLGWQSSSNRAMAAQATLRGIVVRTRDARMSRSVT